MKNLLMLLLLLLLLLVALTDSLPRLTNAADDHDELKQSGSEDLKRIGVNPFHPYYLRRLEEDEPGPLKVGDEYETRIDQSIFSEVIPEISEGKTKAKYCIKHDGASYITVHFAAFDLEEGCHCIVTGKNVGRMNQQYEMTGRGKMELGTFWTQHVKGDTMCLAVKCKHGKKAKEDGHFVIDKMAVGYGPGHDEPPGGRRKATLCGSNDMENAICYSNSHPEEYDMGRAVARLLIQGSKACTGWLVSASNHLVTADHCISSSSAAQNTDYEFMAEAPNCNDSNCQACYRGTIASGATLIKSSSSLDYALVQITSGDPAAVYGFLRIDNRDAVPGEQIYIPQHPRFRAKDMAIASSHDSDGGICQVKNFVSACSGKGYSDVGYMCDTRGGSSGAPVLATSSHKVIALHHCDGCENRGVPMDLIWDEIWNELGPECTVDDHCDDSNGCTSDTCNGGSCTHSTTVGCCGNGICEGGENCTSCPADCINGTSGAQCGNGVCEAGDGEDCISCPSDCNGVQSGKPQNRYCCGNGDGLLSCTDSLCTPGSCTDEPVQTTPYCCGNGACEEPESVCNCEVDCGQPTSETCSDGIDNDCDGAVDCDDADCNGASECTGGCAGNNDPCNFDSDCCSNKCKGSNCRGN